MRRLVSIALTVALAAAAVALQDAKWSYSRAYGPFVKDGRIGRTVAEPRFTIRVERVETAATIAVPATKYEKARIIPANGVFLSVLATVEARHRPLLVADALLHTRYGDYYPTDKFGGGGGLTRPVVTPLSYQRVEPGMPRLGAYVFDVPRDALANARFSVSDRDGFGAPFGFYREDPVRFSAEVRVDLGIDAADARRLLRAPVSGYRLPGPS